MRILDGPMLLFTESEEQVVKLFHEFGTLEVDEVVYPQVLWCSVMLFLAGVLCSAGGIGGGGVYVPVLMVFGLLPPRDAVPLSKAVVFTGALVTLIMNLYRGSASKPYDHDIFGVVVPASLIGTLFGVMLNHVAPDFLILVSLCVVLTSLSVKIFCEARRARCEELEAAPPVAAPSSSAAQGGLANGDGPTHAENNCKGHSDAEPASWLDVCGRFVRAHERSVNVSMLIIVIACGATRYHARNCWQALQKVKMAGDLKECHPTATFFLGAEGLQRLMGADGYPDAFYAATIALPMASCLGVLLLTGRQVLSEEGWSRSKVLQYGSMGVVTGCLAGLLGIGGGLIFAPFFIVMGVPPATAVATSSTCVCFTSSSTAMQYLLTDRIIMSLALIYGAVCAFASFAGTALIHMLQDHFAARKSYIIMIVAGGVLLSALMTFVKMGDALQDQHVSTPT